RRLSALHDNLFKPGSEAFAVEEGDCQYNDTTFASVWASHDTLSPHRGALFPFSHCKLSLSKPVNLLATRIRHVFARWRHNEKFLQNLTGDHVQAHILGQTRGSILALHVNTGARLFIQGRGRSLWRLIPPPSWYPLRPFPISMSQR